MLLVNRDGVEIGRIGTEWQVSARTTRLVDQFFEQVMGAFCTFVFDDAFEGIEPLLGLLRIKIMLLICQWVLPVTVVVRVFRGNA